MLSALTLFITLVWSGIDSQWILSHSSWLDSLLPFLDSPPLSNLLLVTLVCGKWPA